MAGFSRSNKEIFKEDYLRPNMRKRFKSIIMGTYIHTYVHLTSKQKSTILSIPFCKNQTGMEICVTKLITHSELCVNVTDRQRFTQLWCH